MSPARIALALAAALVGCGSSPEPTFYALAPTAPVALTAATPQPAPPGALRTVRVRRPGLAGYLDRPDIVRGAAGFRLRMVATERWGEPLDEMIARVLVQDLAARCPGVTVFGESGAISADPDATVEVDLSRFEQDASGNVTLVAQLAIERGLSHAASSASTVTLTRRPRDGTTAALVEAMSGLLGELSDRAAASLRASP